MLYMQQQAEIQLKDKSDSKDNNLTTGYSEESTRDNIAKLTPKNIHMLNFEDTEEAPGSEELD